ncbi:MAG: PBECR4 domain-containing protein [Firmicutes bacterium]|nr:PBECR4 domain-containing protein [Bacillota bacterium]
MAEKTDDHKAKNMLYDAAVKYGKLLTKGYHIILGRKGKEYHIQLRFPYDSFFHLVGLQHLTDLTYPSKNKERIYKEII